MDVIFCYDTLWYGAFKLSLHYISESPVSKSGAARERGIV